MSKFCCCHIPAVKLTLSSDCDGWRVRVVNRQKYSLSAGIQIFFFSRYFPRRRRQEDPYCAPSAWTHHAALT